MEKLRREVTEAWRGCRHNATLNGLRFEPAPDQPSEYFDWWLQARNEDELQRMSAHAKAKWGLDLTFAQYGRSGATVLPVEWIREDFGGFTLIACDDETGGAKLRQVRNVLRWVTQYCKTYCRSLVIEWQEVCHENALA